MRHELITFGIANQRFGIDIMTVREIRAWSPVTRLPRVPDYVAGVVNLRGAVLPVVDLAARLGWTPTEATPRNPIIVIEHEGQMRGLIVHDVADIVSIEPGTLQQIDRLAQSLREMANVLAAEDPDSAVAAIRLGELRQMLERADAR
jgi:purine-binding chemotaxis protein CheW